MKKQILISLILFGSFLTMNAQDTQWTFTPINTQNSIWTNAKVAIGTPTYGNSIKLTVKSDYTAWSYFASINALPSDGSDGGLYLGSAQIDNAIISSGGTYYNSNRWMSKGTSLSAISLNNGSISFIANTGLSANTEFYPSTKMTIASNGMTCFNEDAPVIMELNRKDDRLGDIGEIIFTLDGSNLASIKANRHTAAGRLTDLQFFTGSSSDLSEKMRITNNGFIGIGTPCPKYTLDVIGTIRAKEVKVDLLGGCDFVFKSDYKLMDLKELETFVKTKQHLPEIAPEKEMVENGVNMKEMQMKLLQKIEELTLYTIEQNKAIEELKHVVKVQNEKIEKLEAASK